MSFKSVATIFLVVLAIDLATPQICIEKLLEKCKPFTSSGVNSAENDLKIFIRQTMEGFKILPPVLQVPAIAVFNLAVQIVVLIVENIDIESTSGQLVEILKDFIGGVSETVGSSINNLNFARSKIDGTIITDRRNSKTPLTGHRS